MGLISKARYGFEIDWFVLRMVYRVEVTALLGAVTFSDRPSSVDLAEKQFATMITIPNQMLRS